MVLQYHGTVAMESRAPSPHILHSREVLSGFRSVLSNNPMPTQPQDPLETYPGRRQDSFGTSEDNLSSLGHAQCRKLSTFSSLTPYIEPQCGDDTTPDQTRQWLDADGLQVCTRHHRLYKMSLMYGQH
jgi:hypothetical protein